MRKLPKGISNYEELIEENAIYVDKTMYIEKLESIEDKRIMFLRPRKFGKTLFTSTIENYYDILKIDKFEKLFSNTYIGKNPTVNKNRYHILRFNFSGIDTTTIETTIHGFKNEIASSVELFVNRYKLDFYITEENTAEDILSNLFKAFQTQKENEKIYVIIDEYDHFANELLGFRDNDFKELLSKNGKIRKWYEVLKKGTETVVDRIFITGVAPITLDSTTSGFNIAKDITKNTEFNDMLGFTKKDVEYLMTELEIEEENQKELLLIIKENYDGYIFSNEIEENIEEYRMYNSNMTLYFLSEYRRLNGIPEQLIDINVISDYRKIEGFMNLCKSKGKMQLLEKIVEKEDIVSELTEKFNSEIAFEETELISLLFYLGYLTIKNKEFGVLKFGSPNNVIHQIYSEYFLAYLKDLGEIESKIDIMQITKGVLLEGKIDKLVEILGEYLRNLSNRDFIKFDEKYVKAIFYAICKNLGATIVKSEVELNGGYADILLVPREKKEERYGVLIEFKYIKKEEYEANPAILAEKQLEAKEQIMQYRDAEGFKLLPNRKCYTVVVIKDEIFLEEV